MDGPNPETFVHDPAGNILGSHERENTNSQQQSNGNRLAFFGDNHYRYDERGNRILNARGKQQSLQQHYAYNALNQLASVENQQQKTSYQYDALGRRISKRNSQSETKFLWLDNTLLSETTRLANGEINTAKIYLYEPGTHKPLAIVQDSEIYHYHLDHLGTPQEITNSRGKLAWSASFKAYGNLAVVHNSEIENNLRFQGQYYDEETGLHYNRFRYYDPECGRFISQDPIGLLGGVNNYQYVPNPTGWVDPLGLSPNEECASTSPKEKYVIIGEGQAAVEAFAKIVGEKLPNIEFRTIKKDWAGIIKKSGANREALFSEEWEFKAVKGNAEWIEQMHNEGYRFIDIGTDNATHRSPFYLAEKKRLAEVGAKVNRAPASKVLDARSTSKLSDRPLALSTEKLKNEGLI